MKAKAAALADGQGKVGDVVESSEQVSKQVADLNKRLDQLMYGDRLTYVEDRPPSFLTRVKSLLKLS